MDRKPGKQFLERAFHEQWWKIQIECIKQGLKEFTVVDFSIGVNIFFFFNQIWSVNLNLLKWICSFERLHGTVRLYNFFLIMSGFSLKPSDFVNKNGYCFYIDHNINSQICKNRQNNICPVSVWLLLNWWCSIWW